MSKHDCSKSEVLKKNDVVGSMLFFLSHLYVLMHSELHVCMCSFVQVLWCVRSSGVYVF